MPVSSGPGARKYDSPIRRQRAGETRERIVTAGCRLLATTSVRDWHALTVRAVADEAGVNERTVYRYFGNERGLRDAVMHQLERDAGIDLEGMGLGDVADITARIFTQVSSYPLRPKPALEPTLADANARQRRALFAALEDIVPQWPLDARDSVAALLDVLWSVATYERLASDWDMDRDQVIGAVAWLIDLIVDAVASDRRPG
jgi:AcrR family transcriptional regulator